jgi:hypothetical protein
MIAKAMNTALYLCVLCDNFARLAVNKDFLDTLFQILNDYCISCQPLIIINEAIIFRNACNSSSVAGRSENT